MRTINRILTVAAAVALAAITGAPDKVGTLRPRHPRAVPLPHHLMDQRRRPKGFKIRDFAYEVPASVKRGSMVTVTNADSAP